MRAVPIILVGLLTGMPAAAEHRFAESLAPIMLADVQTQFAKRGYFAGTPSGQDDAATAAAIRAWQADAGLPVTGIADPALLNHLRFGAGPWRTVAPAVEKVRPAEPPANAAEPHPVPLLPPAPQPEVESQPLPAPF